MSPVQLKPPEALDAELSGWCQLESLNPKAAKFVSVSPQLKPGCGTILRTCPMPSSSPAHLLRRDNIQNIEWSLLFLTLPPLSFFGLRDLKLSFLVFDEVANRDETRWTPQIWVKTSIKKPKSSRVVPLVGKDFKMTMLMKNPVQPWRQQLVPGGDIKEAPFVTNPWWLTTANAIQLAIAITSNFFLLFNMAGRVRFSLAQPITIIGWYISTICRIFLSATAAGPLLKDIKFPKDELIWSQAFYYGIWAAILYFFDASLMAVTFWGALSGHYRKDFMLTFSQRTLMLQTITFLLYLLIGARVFSKVEDWNYLDAVYWADVTLFTIGFGDYAPNTTLGRALLIPYALWYYQPWFARIEEKTRRKMVRTITRKGDDGILKPIREKSEISRTQPDKIPATEFERRRAEFALMRKIQHQSASRRRWMAMASSTFSWLVLWLVGAAIFERTEKPYQNWLYFDSFYFCFEAWTTIGYGDLTPTSNAGKSFFVFWSLLALPTMTVLISHASDTVVKFIRNATVEVGNVTILPGDEGFIGNMKHVISKITFGKAFPGHLDSASPELEASSKSTDQRLDKIMAEPNEQALQGDNRGRPSTSRFRQSPSQVRNHRDGLPTGTDFHFLLISEIQVIASHLKESKPHRYTFDQWAWYLKLMGEDEHNPQTHCKAKPKEKHQDPNDEGSDNDLAWSWVGNRSPLIGSQEETEWILASLMDRLRESLSAERRRQLGSGARVAHQEAQEVDDFDGGGGKEKRA
ncbi:hypothetical protein MRS44_013961 [Fusarium solani]|uniref:uncharacterized protein n=1 Tax=Fusarium solani TaxID=169388 RepID=UPI0032C44BA6|nr:hypothetical protein MRS44_013961 [Fusarium solani]